jgi:hypothetical protein
MSRLTITDDDILEKTEGGKTIFEKVLGEIPNKCINSPLREDNNPSFSVFLAKNGLWMYKDFSNGDSGTAIQFISKLNNINYQESIDYILGMKIDLKSNIKPVIKEKKELVVDWVDMKFSDAHKAYFDQYELDETFLNSRDIYALKTYAINKRIQRFPDYQFKFCYYAKDIDKIKILTLGENVSKEEKWRSLGIGNDYIWNLWRYTKCDNLFVCKSVKDDSVFAKLGYCSVSLQSESAKTFLDNNVTKITNICDNPIIVMGTDPQGFNTSLDITKATGWRWFNVKDKYYKKLDANDPAELVRVYNLKKLKSELKEKGL